MGVPSWSSSEQKKTSSLSKREVSQLLLLWGGLLFL